MNFLYNKRYNHKLLKQSLVTYFSTGNIILVLQRAAGGYRLQISTWQGNTKKFLVNSRTSELISLPNIEILLCPLGTIIHFFLFPICHLLFSIPPRLLLLFICSQFAPIFVVLCLLALLCSLWCY